MQRLESNRRSSRQRGMSLVETLVALLVFTVVFLVALALYQQATKAYQATDSATIQQQNARFAMDRMHETLRDAGANYNPRGRSNVPDEQIEGAWQSAIVVRGDFDNQQVLGRSGEPTLESDANFPIVTTDNDEIVAYVLTKPGSITASTPGANTQPLALIADLTSSDGKRDAIKGTTLPIPGEETSTIYVAALNLAQQTDPPYQLSRITWLPNSTAPQQQVIAENIFRLAFTYSKADGTNAITDATDGSANTERDERELIRKIGVDIITMADRADFGYTDPTNWTNVPPAPTGSDWAEAPAEGTATRNKRKFRLSQEILSVNLGLKGSRHAMQPAVVIEPPPRFTVCVGHHLHYWLTWEASPTANVDYEVSIQSSVAPAYSENETTNQTFMLFKDPEALERQFVFAVRGYKNGSFSTWTDSVTKTAEHDDAQSVPGVPQNVAGPLTGTNRMDVSWDAVETSATGYALAGASQCTSVGTTPGASAPTPPWSTAAPDVKDYRVYRNGAWNAAPGFTPNDATNRVDGITSVPGMPNTTPATPSFTDNTAAPCAEYHYRVKTYDSENIASPDASAAMGTTAKFIAASGLEPAVPAAPVPIGNVTLSGGFWNFRLGWTHVFRDSTNTRSYTAMYRLQRQKELNGSGTWTNDGITQEYDRTAMTAAVSLPATESGQPVKYRYRVIAVYPCAALGDTDRESESDWYYVTCSTPANHSVAIIAPSENQVIELPNETGFTPQLSFQPAAGAQWDAATVEVRGPAPAQDVVYSYTDSASPFTFATFDASSLDDGVYTLSAWGDVDGCLSTPVTRTFIVETVTCGLTLSGTPLLAPTGGANADRRKRLQFRATNNCLTPVIVRSLQLTWTGGTNFTNTRLTGVNYNAAVNTTSLVVTSGSTVPLTTPITINAGATSNIFEIVYSHQMVGTTWVSIIARHGTPPDLVADDILTSSIAPNN
ncbi:MAG TPA: prepilin-type N-terminal cleavage/methylation domain-containing protein [Thermoanaerobaculia bacterium]|nr:prepilin-type N-terminal cleavage/methylation domain-containing protein [Thermoanaerobaculia bacterium]